MTPQARARQAWTIARIELRRAFFAKRSFWVYGLALLPAEIMAKVYFALLLEIERQGLAVLGAGPAQASDTQTKPAEKSITLPRRKKLFATFQAIAETLRG